MNKAFLLFAILCLTMLRANAYLVGPTPTFAEMTTSADIVAKAKVIADATIEDQSFRKLPGFVIHETTFRVISSLKGSAANATFRFRHYAPLGDSWMMRYAPQNYDLKLDRSYLIFAKKKEDFYLPLWESHTMLEDAGAFSVADDKPVEGNVRDVLLSEWGKMLKTYSAEAVKYAIRHLSTYAGGDAYFSKQEFTVPQLIPLFSPLFKSYDPEIVKNLILYLPTRAAIRFENELVNVANSSPAIETRVAAIYKLSGLFSPQVKAGALRWIREASPDVQSAAVSLLVNFPSSDVTQRLHNFARSREPQVRISAANALRKNRDAASLRVLETLLSDKVVDVRIAAATTLLQMPLTLTREVLQRHRRQYGLGPAFTYTLARDDAKLYANEIAVLLKSRAPTFSNFSVEGSNPTYKNWHLLLEWLYLQPNSWLRSSAATPFYEALEVDYSWGSSEPESLYSFYLEKGLDARAANYRQRTIKSTTYDIDFYFKRADETVKQKTLQTSP